MLQALLGMLPGIMGAGGGLFNMFNSKHNLGKPMDTANHYLDQIPGQTNPYYKPYMDAGTDALNTLKGQYGNLVNDPGGMYNKLASGYKESPGYKTRMEEAMRQITNAQAAGGMAGSGQHQQISAGKAMELSGKDFEDYLGHVTGLYGAGLGGEQDIEHQGYNANTDYANMLANLNIQRGKMGYETENTKNRERGQDWANIFGGIGSIGGGYNSYKNHQDILKLLGNMGGG